MLVHNVSKIDIGTVRHLFLRGLIPSHSHMRMI